MDDAQEQQDRLAQSSHRRPSQHAFWSSGLFHDKANLIQTSTNYRDLNTAQAKVIETAILAVILPVGPSYRPCSIFDLIFNVDQWIFRGQETEIRLWFGFRTWNVNQSTSINSIKTITSTSNFNKEILIQKIHYLLHLCNLTFPFHFFPFQTSTKKSAILDIVLPNLLFPIHHPSTNHSWYSNHSKKSFHFDFLSLQFIKFKFKLW